MVSTDVRRVTDLTYVSSLNYYTMKFLGIWPEERKWNQVSSYLVLFPTLTMLLFACAPQTTNLGLIWGDITLVVENLSMANITITISLLKTIAFWRNGKPLKSLLECMANDWNAATKEEDRATMLEIARITKMNVIRSTLFCYVVLVSYVFMRYLTVRYSGYTMFFRAYFPYDTNVSPYYELTFFGQLLAGSYAATTYTAVDTFVTMLVLHACGQLSNLRQEIKSLKACSKQEMQMKLRKIVRKHEYINKFAETIENCFNGMLLLQMLGCTVQLCFQSFQAIMSVNGNDSEFLALQIFFLLLYVVYVMLQLYMYCYVGERLLVESTEIANAAFDCEWFNLSGKNAKLLIIIICRARLPLRITAGKFCSFTLELYAQILKTSMGYISVLYAMQNQ